jgi:KDO2-lipid IV(A) lauroyltransferase
MDLLLYLVALGLVKFLQALPLRWAARFGRGCGALGYALDARHRRVTQRNLTMCLGQERTPEEIRRLARENFRRIGENYACAIKTASMSWEDLKGSVDFVGWDQVISRDPLRPPRSIVVAIGHFGNFELYARIGQFRPEIKAATTYRGLRQPLVDRLMQSLRKPTGCAFFERRTDAAKLKAWMAPTGRVLGLLADQHAGTGGVRVPFFGHECSTTASPAVFALRYNCGLCTGICYRVGLAKWRIELGKEIPTQEPDGSSRRIEAIVGDMNRALEAAVRRDPANWFWVHNRWKPDKPKTSGPRSKAQKPEPANQV